MRGHRTRSAPRRTHSAAAWLYIPPVKPSSNDWESRYGTPRPQGAVYVPDDDAFNFAVTSTSATAVRLLFYKAEDLARPAHEVNLDPVRHRTGHVWHCRVPAAELRGCSYYALRVEGPSVQRGDGSHRQAFDPEKVLFDPYARELFFPPQFDRRAAIGRGQNDGKAPLGVLPWARPEPDWRGHRRATRHSGDLIIYELHVRGFTYDPSSGVAGARRGTFVGLIDKIPYLVDLGITAIELMPVFQFDPQENNFWGYMPLSFFAPHAGYAVGRTPHAAHDEFREMVRAMHAAGIEVIIDVVHNHTAEGDASHPCYSLKGIDNSAYYITGDSPADPYRNFSGTGNTLNASSHTARALVVESMRYWIEEMRIDGFRHDLAAVFSRREDGSIDPDPPLATGFRLVRELGTVRHIVEPWDAAGADHLGRGFPIEGVWQWNRCFRDGVRRFVRGDAGMVGEAMRRMYGSDDLFPDNGAPVCRPAQSVNYVTCHDGFTLYDLVSYTQKRNEANGHRNLDGPSDNLSDNCGHEGDEGVPPEVLARRARRARNFFALLLLANGTPMLRAGDEFLQTQRGNNNPYNQDNQTNWLNWDRRASFPGVWRFCKLMIALRKRHHSIGRGVFWRDDVRWLGPDGAPDWSEPSRAFGYVLSGGSVDDDDLCVMLNMGSEPRMWALPPGAGWRVVVDTGRDSPEDIVADEARAPELSSTLLRVAESSVVVLVRPRFAAG